VGLENRFSIVILILAVNIKAIIMNKSLYHCRWYWKC